MPETSPPSTFLDHELAWRFRTYDLDGDGVIERRDFQDGVRGRGGRDPAAVFGDHAGGHVVPRRRTPLRVGSATLISESASPHRQHPPLT